MEWGTTDAQAEYEKREAIARLLRLVAQITPQQVRMLDVAWGVMQRRRDGGSADVQSLGALFTTLRALTEGR